MGRPLLADPLETPRVEPRSGLVLLFLPAARILFGCEPRDRGCFDDENPAYERAVEGFWIGRTEVTVGAYERCVQARACSGNVKTPTRSPDRAFDPARWASSCNDGKARRAKHPINCIDWNQAQEFCHWIGGRLPTSLEWERAAKGPEGRLYPWGDAPVSGELANFCDRTCHRRHPQFAALHDVSDGWAETAPVGSFPKGASAEGVLDLAGNVWEWTATSQGSDQMEIRGAGWTVDDPRWFRSSNRSWWPPKTRSLDLGFRCVLDELPR